MAGSGQVRLSLLIGPVPMPAPQAVIEALSSVKIENGSGDAQSGFEMSFDLPARSPLRALFLLAGGGGAVPPLMRIVLLVTIGGRQQGLIDGVLTEVSTQPGQGGVGKLVVRGKDLSQLMDLIELNGVPYPAMPPAARVLLMLAKYAAFGVIPMVIPSFAEDLPVPVQRIPQQRGTDYRYVKQLASDCGYVFYLEPGPLPATSKAYWGPEIRIGIPQPALTVNMDALSNCDSLQFTMNRERRRTPLLSFQEPISKQSIPLPIPSLSPLSPPLGLVTGIGRTEQLDDNAHRSPIGALMSGLAFAARNDDDLSGSGQIDVGRYGQLLQSRQLVGVRGAGEPYDGLYYVKSVTHEIRRGEYKQQFQLARNGLLSTLPRVPS